MEFQHKTALVNGGASGMGLLTAQRFARYGANVVIADVDEDAATSVAEAICAEGGTAIAVQTDCRDYKQVQHAVQKALEFNGTIDYLLNFAGGNAARVFGRSERFADLDIEIIEWGIDVNFRGPIYYAHAAIKHMIKNRSGVIINLGSIDGITGSLGIEYGASKTGIIGLTRSLAILGAPHGVRVCCVSPGPVLTRKEMAEMSTLLGRAAQPEEIVDLIEYLCSSKAAFITGTNYTIDGGRSCGVISYPKDP